MCATEQPPTLSNPAEAARQQLAIHNVMLGAKILCDAAR